MAGVAEELRAELQRLSLDAVGGDEAAMRRVEEIEKAIADAERAGRLEELAHEERARLEEEQRQIEEERRVEEARERYRAIAHQKARAIEELEKHVEALCEDISTILEADQEQRNEAQAAGVRLYQTDAQTALGAWFTAQLAPYFPDLKSDPQLLFKALSDVLPMPPDLIEPPDEEAIAENERRAEEMNLEEVARDKYKRAQAAASAAWKVISPRRAEAVGYQEPEERAALLSDLCNEAFLRARHAATNLEDTTRLLPAEEWANRPERGSAESELSMEELKSVVRQELRRGGYSEEEISEHLPLDAKAKV